MIAVGIAYVLRGHGGGESGIAAAQGTLTQWFPRRTGEPTLTPEADTSPES
jgi:hypothetical protein